MNKNIDIETKRNWIVINIGHERYSFDTDIKIYNDMSLQELGQEEWNINLEKIEKVREDSNDYSYILDYCNHSEIDTKYTYPDFNDKQVNHFHIDVTFIFDLETFLAEQYNSFVWGITNNKFGLLDIQGDAE